MEVPGRVLRGIRRRLEAVALAESGRREEAIDEAFYARDFELMNRPAKGFVPTAVLEETGLPGAMAFVWILGTLWLTVWRSRDPLRVALFVGAM